MAAFLGNLRNTVLASFALALLMLAAYLTVWGGSLDMPFWRFLMRWAHVLSGIMWVGLLWYFNFVQIPTMPSIPDEQKPAIGKHIAPKALFWFRWASMSTIITGLILASLNGYIVEALSLGLAGGSAGHVAIGIGMWLGVIMWFNVWFIIWPNQQKALNIANRYPDLAADAKAAAAKKAMLFSRTNTLLSAPMLFAMIAAQSLFRLS